MIKEFNTPTSDGSYSPIACAFLTLVSTRSTRCDYPFDVKKIEHFSDLAWEVADRCAKPAKGSPTAEKIRYIVTRFAAVIGADKRVYRLREADHFPPIRNKKVLLASDGDIANHVELVWPGTNCSAREVKRVRERIRKDMSSA